MKISFILPVFNVEKYLVECIESLLNQTVKDFEIILVDDGSTDSSGGICDEYQNKYENIHCIHQENAGVAVARNVGLRESSGEWIFFVDSDDVVSKDLIKQCIKYLNSKNDICFVGHKEMLDGVKMDERASNQQKTVEIVAEDFKEIRLAVFNRDKRGKFDYHAIKLSTPCKFFRRELLIDNGIEYPRGICTGEDALFNLQVYDVAKRGYFVQEKLYYHRVWRGSVSKRYDPNAVKHFDELNAAMLRYVNAKDTSGEFISAYNERCIWSVGFCCILNFCNKDNPELYRARKKQFQEMRGKYKAQIMKVDLKQFRLQKKILFYFIKKNNFELISLLCYLQGKISVN